MNRDNQHTCNGWTNYETQAVSLRINNEIGSYRFWKGRTEVIRREEREKNSSEEEFSQAAYSRLAEELKAAIHAECEIRNATLAADLMSAALAEVDWREIAKDMIDDFPSQQMPKIPEVHPIFGELIHSYSRADAIADGVLIDVTETAKEAGFRHPVALTSTVWGTCIEVPEGVAGQDKKGRLWDVLTMMAHASRSLKDRGSVLLFDVLVLNDMTTPKPVRLKAVCGPNDDATPCVTVMFPEED
jgi:hypothetical protein